MHVAGTAEARNAYKILVGKLLGKRPLTKPRRRWNDNIKVYVRKVDCKDGSWMEIDYGRVKWLHLVLAVLKLQMLPPVLDYCEKS